MIPAFAVCVISGLALPWLLLPMGHRVLFAVLPVVPVAVYYARAIRRGAPGTAAALALAWAIAITLSTVAAASRSPEQAGRAIWNASAYRDEMLRWIATGVGAEGNIRLFLPRVLVEYALVLALSSVTLGAAALLLGGILLGYMNGYVGWVIAHADPKVPALQAAFTAWPPWPMARVISFVLGATAAAAWGYRRFFRRGAEVRGRSIRRLFFASAILLVLDVGLKWWLAPEWRLLLKGLLGASAGIEAGGSG